MEGIHQPLITRIDEVFADFKGRRAGLIKALTSDVNKFHHQCDPEKKNLWLYGFPNETWEVSLPVQKVPPKLPEPTLGINFARNGMQEKEWLSFVAVHSDSWLLGVAFCFATHFGFGKNERKKLFQLINKLPTVFEVVTGSVKEGSLVDNQSTRRNQSVHTRPQQVRGLKMHHAELGEESGNVNDAEDDEQGTTHCGACWEIYANDEFWIYCDLCERWFHGNCVKITPSKAEHIIKIYKCPDCSSKGSKA